MSLPEVKQKSGNKAENVANDQRGTMGLWKIYIVGPHLQGLSQAEFGQVNCRI
jgi:hypothetical protein